MPTATKIIHDERLYVEQMRAYVSKLKEQVENPSHAVKRDAKKNAKKALMETGVINKNGSIKKKIVSWE